VNDIEILIALVAAAIVLVRLADAVSIPYPIVLVLGGLGIGFLPGGPSLELQPDVVFLVFLPPLLQSAGYWASPQELKAELVPLTWLVIGLTLATMVAVAAIAQAVIPSINWAEGFVLGAIVAPTDPVSAIATFDRVGVTDRVATLVEGEAMVNDAVALVSYKVALAAVVSGTLTASTAVDDLIVGVAGGIAIGLAMAWLMILMLRQVDDAPLVACSRAGARTKSSTPISGSTPSRSGECWSSPSTPSSSSLSACNSPTSSAQWASSSHPARSSATG